MQIVPQKTRRAQEFELSRARVGHAQFDRPVHQTPVFERWSQTYDGRPKMHAQTHRRGVNPSEALAVCHGIKGLGEHSSELSTATPNSITTFSIHPMKSILVLASLIVSVFAQSATIAVPAPGTTLVSGSQITIEVDQSVRAPFHTM